jgi:hypothetical protein
MRFGGGVCHRAASGTGAAHHSCANRGAADGGACDRDHTFADDGCAAYHGSTTHLGGSDGHTGVHGGPDDDRGASSSGSGCRL